MTSTSYWVRDGWAEADGLPVTALYRLDGSEARWHDGGPWEPSDVLLGALLAGSADWRDLPAVEARGLFPAAMPNHQ